MLSRLDSHQAYAANQLRWRAFGRNLARVEAFELRRGAHPREAVAALQALLGASARSATHGIRPCASL
jgi:hypothetical protein